MINPSTPTWLTAGRQKLADLARTIEDWTPRTLYGAVAGMTLLPLAATSDDPRTVLAGIVGGIGANLIANQLEAWQARDDETERSLASQLTENARTDDGLRAALDTLLEKVNALQTLVEELPADERTTTMQLLDAQFKKLGSRLTVTGDHNITTDGNVDNSNLVTGSNNQITNTEYHFHTVAESFVRTLTAKPLSDAELQSTTERYLQLLWHKHSILDIKGIGMADRVSLNLPLLAMYVPLKARIELPEGETWSRALKLAGRAVSEEERLVMGERLSAPLPLLNLLAEHAGLVILGDPGAGKTTFLKHLALGLALDQPPLPALAQRLPILIPLAAYANELAQQDCSLQDFLADYYRRQGIEDLPVADLLRSALRNGRALLLFDGLDEVQESGQRARVVNRVETFFAHHRQSGNKFVLTSRIVGYRDAPLSAPGVQTCTLVDFAEEEQTAFVDKWSVVLEEAIRGKNPEAGKAAAAEKAELLAALQHNPGVQQLAANPLLLTILALMKRQGVVLPERRVELYEKYIETLLHSWNVARGLDRYTGGHHPNYHETRKVLTALAYWLQKVSPGRGLVKETALRLQLENIYRDRGEHNPAQAADQLLKDVRNYASLLLERGVGEYGFIHLTFMEYLAACHIEQHCIYQGIEAIWEIICPYLLDSRWREVILLLLGNLNRYDTVNTQLLDKILIAGKEDKFEPVLHNYLYLSAQILANKIEVFDTVHEQIVNDLLNIALYAPNWEKESAFNALARLEGDKQVALKLFSMAQDPETDDWIKYKAAFAFGKLGYKEQAVNLLFSFALDPQRDELNRIYVLQALCLLGQVVQANRILLSMVENLRLNFVVRDVAAEVLGQMARLEPPLVDTIVGFAIKSYENEQLCYIAIAALGELDCRTDARILQTLLILVDTPTNYLARNTALQSLHKLRCREPKVINILKNLINDRSLNSWTCSMVVQALSQSNYAAQMIIDTLFTLTSKVDLDTVLYRSIVYAFGELGHLDPKVYDFLIKLVENLELDSIIRATAIQALRKLNCRESGFIDILIVQLKDTKVQAIVRKAAAEALCHTRLYNEQAVNTLLHLAQNVQIEEWVRRSSIAALGHVTYNKLFVLEALLRLIQTSSSEEWIRSESYFSMARLLDIDIE
ncbi:MAG: NACHT domain-containing protein [Caldilineaceae bacterium]